MLSQKHKRSSSDGLQRHQLEISLICVSGVVLGFQAVQQSPYDCGWLTAGSWMVHALCILLEFFGDTLVSPYKLRRCESHGLSQGTLAVPSVLSALAVRGLKGSSYLWQLGSYAAAVAMLMTVCVQSKRAKALSADGSVEQEDHKHSTGKVLRPNGASQKKADNQGAGSHTQWFGTVQNSWTAAAAMVLAGIATSMLLLPQQMQHYLISILAWHAEPWRALAAAALGAIITPALYCLIMQLLPSCFSIGEGAMMAQGAAAMLVLAVQTLPQACLSASFPFCGHTPDAAVNRHAGGSPWFRSGSTAAGQPATDQALPAAIVLIVAAVLVVCFLVHCVVRLVNKSSIKAANSYSILRPCRWLAIGVLAAIICGIMAWLGCAAVWTILEFLPAKPGRLLVLLYWAALLAATLPALRVWASHSHVPQIIVRKAYHLLAGALFIPVFFWDLQMLCLSLAIGFAALVLLEVVRKLKVPGLGQAVQRFMQEFVDERDSGPIYITHFTLLLGIAIPMWLSLGVPVEHLAVYPHQQLSSSGFLRSTDKLITDWQSCPEGNNVNSTAAGFCHKHLEGNDVSMSGSSSSLLPVMAGLSGMIIIGVGDTAASAVGKLVGRIPVYAGSRKTVEGTIAGIASSLCAWYCLLWCVGLQRAEWQWWCKLAAVTIGAGLLEACTSQLDNILLPLWYMPHLLLLM